MLLTLRRQHLGHNEFPLGISPISFPIPTDRLGHHALVIKLRRYRLSSETLSDRTHHIRESWVKAMEARLVREELVKCQRAEGVNHYKECQHLAEMYTGMIRENKVSFYDRLSDRMADYESQRRMGRWGG